MRKIELIYDSDCPNTDTARAHLRQVLHGLGLPQFWTEWNRADSQSPHYAQQYGSPTILVDGHDIAGVSPGDGANSCRVYTGPDGRTDGVPPIALIASAVHGPRRLWQHLLPTLPSLGVALLPVGLCPACWPAYAGVLAALGVPFLWETRYLLPLVLGFLVLALGSLAWRAKTRRGYRPFLVGLLGAFAIFAGKFVISFDGATYGGVALLFGASVWNAWPRMPSTHASCSACAHPGAGHL